MGVFVEGARIAEKVSDQPGIVLRTGNGAGLAVRERLFVN
jgi:hypothetical protein